MAGVRILISGLGGLGVEVAKNVIISGPYSVALHDQKTCSWFDMSSQFYLSGDAEGNIDKNMNRAKASMTKLAEINHVRVHLYNPIQADGNKRILSLYEISTSKPEELKSKFDLIVVTDYFTCEKSEEFIEILEVGEFCHNAGIKFILCETRGVFSRIFVDIGHHDSIIKDTNSEKISSSSIKEFMYNRGIEASNDCENDCFTNVNDIGKLILAFHTFNRFSRLPELEKNFEKSEEEFVNLAKKIHKENKSKKKISPSLLIDDQSGDRTYAKFTSEMDSKFLKIFHQSLRSTLSPFCTYIGGIVLKEILQITIEKQIPPKQFGFGGYPEIMKNRKLPKIAKYKNRNISQIVLFGENFQEKLERVSCIIEDVDVLGGELIKTMTMMGIGSSFKPGGFIVTDYDLVEVANQEFFLNSKSNGTPKSIIASNLIKDMNPGANIMCLSDAGNGLDYEKIFNVDVFKNYNDTASNCFLTHGSLVYYYKPIFESKNFESQKSELRESFFKIFAALKKWERGNCDFYDCVKSGSLIFKQLFSYSSSAPDAEARSQIIFSIASTKAYLLSIDTTNYRIFRIILGTIDPNLASFYDFDEIQPQEIPPFQLINFFHRFVFYGLQLRVGHPGEQNKYSPLDSILIGEGMIKLLAYFRQQKAKKTELENLKIINYSDSEDAPDPDFSNSLPKRSAFKLAEEKLCINSIMGLYSNFEKIKECSEGFFESSLTLNSDFTRSYVANCERIKKFEFINGLPFVTFKRCDGVAPAWCFLSEYAFPFLSKIIQHINIKRDRPENSQLCKTDYYSEDDAKISAFAHAGKRMTQYLTFTPISEDGLKNNDDEIITINRNVALEKMGQVGLDAFNMVMELEESTLELDKDNIYKYLPKLPPHHQELVQGFYTKTIKFQDDELKNEREQKKQLNSLINNMNPADKQKTIEAIKEFVFNKPADVIHIERLSILGEKQQTASGPPTKKIREDSNNEIDISEKSSNKEVSADRILLFEHQNENQMELGSVVLGLIDDLDKDVPPDDKHASLSYAEIKQQTTTNRPWGGGVSNVTASSTSSNRGILYDPKHPFKCSEESKSLATSFCVGNICNCGKGYGALAELTKHIKSVEMKLAGAVCEICQAKFDTKSGLKKHMTKKHSSLAPKE